LQELKRKKNQDRDDIEQCTLHAAQQALGLLAPTVGATWGSEEQQTEPALLAHLSAPMTQAMPWHNVPPVKKSASTQIITQILLMAAH
jgi:hypothetical protein